ncbi:MAG: hypothetical protein ACP5VS_13800 [Desulfomonilaceae bacterium]
MNLKEIKDYSDIVNNASPKWHYDYTNLLERAMAYHLPVHVQRKVEDYGVSYEKAHQLTWLDQWAAEGEMYVRAFVEILALDDEMLETLLTGTFVVSEDIEEFIPGYTYPNRFLVGLGGLDPNVLQTMKKTVQVFRGGAIR